VDGSPKDQVVDGRLFRPASLARALEEYPSIVQWLLKANTKVSFQSSANGVGFVSVRDPDDPGRWRHLCTSDYVKCVDVVRSLGYTPIFISEPMADINSRIRALLEVQFANRGAF
jgi:hypothetical protein